MKFLAILRDSLREAIDSKVIYVTIGLSVFLTAIAMTMTFKPRPAKEMMQIAAGFLSIDASDFDPDQLMGRLATAEDIFEVVSASPRDGAPDAPSSSYIVVLRQMPNKFRHKDETNQPEGEQKKPIKKEANGLPLNTEDRITRGFGALSELRILEVQEVKLLGSGEPGLPESPDPESKYYAVKTAPTPATLRFWPHEFSLFFGGLPLLRSEGLPLGLQLYLIEDFLINTIGAWVVLLISVIITAFFIPNMLRKGTIDLLLVKPIHRSVLLLYKYVGGLTFIFLNTCVAVGGVWLAVGLRSGIWAPGFLYTIPAIVFFFAILYSFSTLFGVVTRSPIAAILLTIGAWFMIWVVGFIFYTFVEPDRLREERKQGEVAARSSQNAFYKTVTVIHYVLPRAKDLDKLTSQVLIRDLLTANQIKAQNLENSSVSWGESLTVSGIYIALSLLLSCLWFSTRDY